MMNSKKWILILIFISAISIPLYAAQTDGEILDVVKTSNNSEISVSELASTKATNPEVREFALLSLQELKNNNQRVDALSQKFNINLASSVKSTAMKSETELKLLELQRSPATQDEFDRNYVQYQIDTNNNLLSEINDSLLPTTQNEEIKVYLRAKRGEIQGNLNKANKILLKL